VLRKIRDEVGQTKVRLDALKEGLSARYCHHCLGRLERDLRPRVERSEADIAVPTDA
jgi:hypothetical protein